MLRYCAKGFSLVELLVVIGIIGLLLGILLPSLEKVRHRGYVVACESNLRQLGMGLSAYANENRGSFPRTTYVPGQPPVAGTGIAATDPFSPAGPQANDVSAAIWLLLRVQQLPTSLVICPYNDVNEFVIDSAQPANQSNFTSYGKNLGYSYANPYPDAVSTQDGYRMKSHISGSFVLMADLNPGVVPARGSDVYAPVPNSPSSIMERANSENHEQEGQNVLFADGHVTYELTPFCGVNGDNIYTSQKGVPPTVATSPAGPDDTILLPLD